MSSIGGIMGTYSGGSHIRFPGLSPDLCVPFGLVMPDQIEFLVEDEKREEIVENVPSINDSKFEDLFHRISYNKPPSKKNKTKKKRG